ncbi:hypothetical protein CI109_103890 [Kwoniella shandongensis]|uniref:Uncharacterized protein n=1 Tax=Kwoniella shandongensis TaxID=1734106 RepID=A0A5M6BVH4_9TREE|nr:uncharacterized protein CI109_005656 [Kwoniella shandongensis]KAA5526060.1 hypothetical protein CI109_005656 [Kwoniella shandongensis]
MSYKSPNSNPSVTADPNNTGQAVSRAFLIEAVLNVASFPLITHPRFVLSLLLLQPHHINPSTVLFARLFGGLVVGVLTPLLLAGVPNTRNAIESRRITYLSLGLGECLLIPLLIGEALKGGKGTAALSPRASIGAIMCLAPPLIWRLYVLLARPDLLGRYKEIKRE